MEFDCTRFSNSLEQERLVYNLDTIGTVVRPYCPAEFGFLSTYEHELDAAEYVSLCVSRKAQH